QRLRAAPPVPRAPRPLLAHQAASGPHPPRAPPGPAPPPRPPPPGGGPPPAAGAGAVASPVRELADEGVAVLLSSHQIGELEQVCDSYTFLREGRVVWDGTAGELEAEAPQSAFALH